jgi:hypothetical protein
MGDKMSEQILYIGLIIFILAFIGLRRKRKYISSIQNMNAIDSKKAFIKLLKASFPKYKILHRNDAYMICEINHRDEFEEIVFIRIRPNQLKKIHRRGRILEANYSQFPSKSEMRKDFNQHL